MNIQQEINITCPHCFETLTIDIDPTAGEEQEWEYDCEVCCHAMTISASWSSENDRYDANAVKTY